MTRALPIVLALALAACGVDGPPVAPGADPEDDRPRTGVTITGSAEIGVGGRF